MTERSNHTVVSTPGDHIQILTQDRDEWKRRALAAEEHLRSAAEVLRQYSLAYERGFEDGRAEALGMEVK